MKPSFRDETETFDGSSWTEVGDLNSARNQLTGAGTTTAALVCGGENPTAYNSITETWNGTSWTEVNNLNTARINAGGSGLQTSFLCYGGATPSVTVNTEEFDGVGWTEVANLSTGRTDLAYGSQGTQASCLATGGTSPGPTFYNNTEEWTKGQNVKVLTD